MRRGTHVAIYYTALEFSVKPTRLQSMLVSLLKQIQTPKDESCEAPISGNSILL
jgi:hypothetical protein